MLYLSNLILFHHIHKYIQGYYTAGKNKKSKQVRTNLLLLAEREGFEPPVPLGTAVFKTAVIDHSTISPKRW